MEINDLLPNAPAVIRMSIGEVTDMNHDCDCPLCEFEREELGASPLYYQVVTLYLADGQVITLKHWVDPDEPHMSQPLAPVDALLREFEPSEGLRQHANKIYQ